MKIELKDPPRSYTVGSQGPAVTIRDCGRVFLQSDEQFTFFTESGAEYDFTRKSWGFYATPSLNSRLARFGLRGVLVRNPGMLYYLLIVEHGREADFEAYVADWNLTILCWLDSTESIQRVEALLNPSGP